MNFEMSVKAIETYIDNMFRCNSNFTELELLQKFHKFAEDNELPIVLELIGYAYFPLAEEKVRLSNSKKELVTFDKFQLN